MKITLLASAFAVLSLTACETMPTTSAPAASMSATRITTAEQFNRLIVGKRITHQGTNFFTIAADGTLSGEFGGNTLLGTWQWEDQYWCRTLTTVRPGTGCQAWEINGKEITVTRERGTGGTATYMLE